MKLGKRRYSMNSIAVARGCSCYTRTRIRYTYEASTI